MNADWGPSKCGMGSLFRPHPCPLPQERGCCAQPAEAVEATEADEGDQVGRYRSINMIRSHPITSDQIRPNPTKKKWCGPDQGAGRWIKTGADKPRSRSSSLDAGKCCTDEWESQWLERT